MCVYVYVYAREEERRREKERERRGVLIRMEREGTQYNASERE